MRVAAVEPVRGKRRDFEKRRARIEQQADAVANEQLAARDMARSRVSVAAKGGRGQLFAQGGNLRPHGAGIGLKLFGSFID